MYNRAFASLTHTHARMQHQSGRRGVECVHWQVKPTAAVRSLRIAMFHGSPETWHGPGAPKSHVGLCEVIYRSDSDRRHAVVSGVPGLFSVPDTHVGQAHPPAFDLFLIKSIIEAHKSFFF